MDMGSTMMGKTSGFIRANGVKEKNMEKVRKHFLME